MIDFIGQALFTISILGLAGLGAWKVIKALVIVPCQEWSIKIQTALRPKSKKAPVRRRAQARRPAKAR